MKQGNVYKYKHCFMIVIDIFGYTYHSCILEYLKKWLIGKPIVLEKFLYVYYIVILL